MKGAVQYEILELGRAFKWGFFSDGVVRTIELYPSGEIPKNKNKEKKLLTKAHEFLEMVEKGEQQVDTGRLQSNAVDSIGAYRRSLSAFIYHQPDNRDFKSYIESMKNSLSGMIKSEYVDPQQIEMIKQFFKVMSVSTFEETERLLEKRKETPKWTLGSKML